MDFSKYTDIIFNQHDKANPSLYLGLIIGFIIIGHYLPMVKTFIRPIHVYYHESSHALTAMLVGFRVSGFKVFLNGEGLTSYYHNNSKIRLAMVGVAGYPGPALIGCAIGIATLTGYSGIAALILTVLSVAYLLLSRSPFSIVVSLVMLTFSIFSLINPNITLILTIMSALLIGEGISGTIDAIQMNRQQNKSGEPNDGLDATILTRTVGLSANFWTSIMVIVAIASVGSFITVLLLMIN